MFVLDQRTFKILVESTRQFFINIFNRKLIYRTRMTSVCKITKRVKT